MADSTSDLRRSEVETGRTRAHAAGRSRQALSPTAFASLLILLCLGATALAVPAEAGSRAAADEAVARQFADPGADERPKIRWWFPGLSSVSREQIEREIEAIADAGIGGVEISSPELALTAHQNDLLTTILDAARESGITVDLTIGTAAARVPSISANDGTDQQELVFGRALVDGGATFSGAVPAPTPNPDRPKTLVAVVGARCTADCTTEAPILLDRDSLVDLTEQVVDGRVSWTAPGEGNWILLGFWRRSTDAPFAPPGTPYADHFSAAGARALTDYWDEHVFTPQVQALVDDVGDELFEDSLHLQAFHLWTPDLLTEFERRRGYSLRRYLPVTIIADLNRFLIASPLNDLTPDSPAEFDFAGDTGKRIRNDYYQTLSELYEVHHLRKLQRWANGHGLRFRSQPAYGHTLDISAAATVDVPETESFQNGDTLEAYRSMAGPVHMGDRNVFSTECCATSKAVGRDLYSTTWQQMLSVIHGNFAGGVNQVVLHGFNYADAPGAVWPGFTMFAAKGPLAATLGPVGLAEAFGPRVPDWRHMPEISALLGREQLVLRQGEPRIELAVYKHSYWSYGFPVLRGDLPHDLWLKDTTLERSGYTYDFIGPELLGLAGATVKHGRLAPTGPAYKALVLDTPEQVNSVRGMPLREASRMLRYARAGLPIIVVGATPDRTGFFGDAGQDDEVRRTMARLLRQPSVRSVAAESDLPEALATLGVRADSEPARPSNVLSVHRATPAADYYFLHNQKRVDPISGEPDPAPAPFDQRVSFAGRGRPYELDAWTGRITPIATYTQADGRVKSRVRLAPGESTIVAIRRGRWRNQAAPGRVHATDTTADEVVLDRRGVLRVRAARPGRYTTRLSDGRVVKSTIGDLPTARTISDWTLSVEDWRPGATASQTEVERRELRLSSLRSWPDIPELQDVSGIGRYAARVDLGPGWTRARRRVRLDLGPLFDSVRVLVNGRSVGPVDRYRAVVDITRHLTLGRNTIELEVATTLRNRLRTLLDSWPAYADLDRQPYGLVGPVRLIPFGEAAINPSSARR